MLGSVQISDRRVVNVAVFTAAVTILAYLIVSSSRELALFAPIPTSPTLLYAVTVAAGLHAGLAASTIGQGVLRLGAIIGGSLVIYGCARTLSAIVLLDAWPLVHLLAFMAIQRILIYGLTMGAFGVVGLMVGMVIRSIFPGL